MQRRKRNCEEYKRTDIWTLKAEGEKHDNRKERKGKAKEMNRKGKEKLKGNERMEWKRKGTKSKGKGRKVEEIKGKESKQRKAKQRKEKERNNK